MQLIVYSFIFQFLTRGFSIVNAIIGHNVKSLKENEYPFVVCISRYYPDVSWQYRMLCTGTLISHHFVLSAVHCFDPGVRYELAMGSHYSNGGDKYYPAWWISYNQWAEANEPGYLTGPIADDIQLIKVLGIQRNITPCEIAPIDPPDILYGLHAYIVGCGRVENNTYPQLKKIARIRIMDINVCSEVMSCLEKQEIQLDKKYSCSMGTPYTQLHYGDSGGPLLYHGALIGINAATAPRMNDTFHPNKVNIHVNINRYNKFLRIITSDAS